jgi:hypothetical protein
VRFGPGHPLSERYSRFSAIGLLAGVGKPATLAALSPTDLLNLSMDRAKTRGDGSVTLASTSSLARRTSKPPTDEPRLPYATALQRAIRTRDPPIYPG